MFSFMTFTASSADFFAVFFPEASAVIKQYESAAPAPNIPEMAEVWTGAESLMFDAASGKKTAKKSADDAVNVIKENIREKYVK